MEKGIPKERKKKKEEKPVGKRKSKEVSLESAIFSQDVDLGQAEGTPRSARESPISDFKKIFDALPVSASVLDLDGVIVAVNQQYLLLTGFAEKEMVGEHLSKFLYVSKSEGDDNNNNNVGKRNVERYIVESIQGGGAIYNYDMHYLDKAGQVIPISFCGNPIKNEDGNIVGIIGVGRDMMEVKRLEMDLAEAQETIYEYKNSLEKKMKDNIDEVNQRTRILEELSITDELTKLYNRRYLFKRLHEEFHRSNRYGDRFSVVMLDLDHFKKVNDTYGHQAGDMVLYEIAGILRRSIRQMDMVARFGGEEFVVLLPSIEESHAYLFCERLREKIRNFQFTYLPKGVFLTVSMGIVDYPTEGLQDVDLIIKAADKALYKAKETRDANVLYSSLEESLV